MRVGDGERETGGRRRRGRGIEIRSCIYTRAEIMATEQELKANRTESTLYIGSQVLHVYYRDPICAHTANQNQ